MLRKYKIKYLSSINGVSGVDLAKLLNKSETTISQYLKLAIDSPRSIPSDDLRIIAGKLNCSMEELYTEPLNAESDAKA